jgi:hypothetical protein
MWTNCRPQKFWVQDVYGGTVDDTSFGCKIYNSANPGVSWAPINRCSIRFLLVNANKQTYALSCH